MENLEELDSLFDYALDRLSAERCSSRIDCKICGSETQLFDVVDFKKSCNLSPYPGGLSGIPIFYRSCSSCKFIFTTFFDGFNAEQWRNHIYNERYAEADPEYLDIRPRQNVLEIEQLLARKENTTVGLDYGGGNGLTAMLLRQKGWNYDTYDPYGHSDFQQTQIGKYNFCSAFEVFEHSPDPVSTLSEIIRMTSPDRLMIFIGTSVHDNKVRPDNRLAWWYAAPRNGHVSLYSRSALQLLGQRFGLTYVSVSPGTHLLLRAVSEREARFNLVKGKLLGRLRQTFAGRR